MPFDSARTIVHLPRPEPFDGEGALLDLSGPVDGLHVLVIGPGGLGPMLGLHRRGAAQVTVLRAGARVAVEAADAALVPRLHTPDGVDAAIACARRAIRPLNSLVLQFTPNAPATLLAYTRRRLAVSGFTAGRVVALGSCTALVADLPLVWAAEMRLSA